MKQKFSGPIKTDQFKPRKSSFGSINFRDAGGRQPQSDSEDMEDYDEEDMKDQIEKLENEIKAGGYEPPKPA